MNERNTLWRKVAYGVAMAVLLVPLYLLGTPRTVDDPGGALAKLRTEHQLGQVDLGEIDPASETMKLATLGLRGVAVQVLWRWANENKKKENWSELTATLDVLAKLQPNFITFWKFQSWNQSYNLSVEFDDYRDRYYYVRRGIEFLEEGERYNRDNPQILWELGWFLGQKIGRADEKVQYRRLFKADDQYHDPRNRPVDRRDNWLVSKDWYEESVFAADVKGRGIGRKSPIVFYSSGPKSQMNYAEAIEDEGVFGPAEFAWKTAEEEWRDFGNLEIEHSTGTIVRLGSEEELQQKVDEANERLVAIWPEAIELIVADRRAGLTDEERAALDKPEEERSEREVELAYGATGKLRYKPRDIADRIGREKPELRRAAAQMAAEVEHLEKRLRYTDNYKDTANYDYWLTRCLFEQTADAIEARRQIDFGKRLFKDERNPFEARKYYERGLQAWKRVFDAYPELYDPQGTTGDDILYFIIDYNRLLEQLDEEMPDGDQPGEEYFQFVWQLVRDFDLDRDLAEELQAHDERMRAKDQPAGDQPEEEPGDSANADSANADSANADSANADSDEADSDEADSDDASNEDPDDGDPEDGDSENNADSEETDAAAQ